MISRIYQRRWSSFQLTSSGIACKDRIVCYGGRLGIFTKDKGWSSNRANFEPTLTPLTPHKSGWFDGGKWATSLPHTHFSYSWTLPLTPIDSLHAFSFLPQPSPNPWSFLSSTSFKTPYHNNFRPPTSRFPYKTFHPFFFKTSYDYNDNLGLAN